MFSEGAPKGIVRLTSDRKVGLYFCFPNSRCVLTSKGEDLRTYWAMTSEQNVHSPFLNLASPYYRITLERSMQLSLDSNLGVYRYMNIHDLIRSVEVVGVKGFILSRVKWLKKPKGPGSAVFSAKFNQQTWFLPKIWKYSGSIKLKITYSKEVLTIRLL